MKQLIESDGGVCQYISLLNLPTDIEIGSLAVHHFEPDWHG